MYNIVISDKKDFLHFFPKKERYEILFYSGHSVSFSNRREAYAFVSKVSSLFSETLHLCEMFHNSLNTYKSHLESSSPTNYDLVNIYFNNDVDIYKTIKEIKFFKWKKQPMHKVVREFHNLFVLLRNNVEIICKKIKSNTNHLQNFIQKFTNHFFKIIAQIKELHESNNITLFIA